MTSTQIGYSRYSTDKQDLTAPREALITGVDPERVYRLNKKVCALNCSKVEHLVNFLVFPTLWPS